MGIRLGGSCPRTVSYYSASYHLSLLYVMIVMGFV